MGAALAGAPANDGCSTAAPITAVPQTMVTPLAQTTPDAADPVPMCYPIATEHTVWYTFTPGLDQQVRMDTTDSIGNTVISVYIGSCEDLTQIDCDHNYGIGGSYNHGMVDFYAEAGQTYRIMVSGPFPPAPTYEAVVDVSPGQSNPVTFHVTDAESGAGIAGAHVWVRDTTGGNYTIREGFTGADGRSTVYPPFQLTFDGQAAAMGHVVATRPFSNAAPAQVSLALDPMGPLPLPGDAPARIAFISGEGLSTMLPDGSDERLVLATGCEKSPVWSPDGSRIAFAAYIRLEDGLCTQAVPWGVYAVDADGSNLELISDDTGGQPRNLTWSPDGTTILYDQFRPGEGYSSIWKVDVATGAVTRLKTFATQPSYSPDGSMIVFSGSNGTRIARADGSNELTISGLGGNPDWSPDGTHIAVGDGAITVMRADGTDPQTVVDIEHESYWEPSWSPDGTQIAFGGGEYGTYMHRVNLDGSAFRRVRLEGVVPNGGWEWSLQPTDNVPGDDTPLVELHDPDGGEWLVPGQVHPIHWDAFDTEGIASQDLYLIEDRGPSFPPRTTPIALGLSGSARSFDWTVPDVWSHIGARVRIWITDTAGQDVTDQSRYPFSISDGTDPYVMLNITHPAGGESFLPGEVVTITWEEATYWTPTDKSLELSLDGGNTFDYIEPFVPWDADSYDWIVPEETTGSAVVRMYSNGVYSARDESGFFSIDVPTVANLELAGAELTLLTWEPPGLAPGMTYDVIRGDLSVLHPVPGDPGSIDLGVAGCVEDDAPVAASSDEAMPQPGEAWFYLVRPNGSGSYGSASDGKRRTPAGGDCPPD